MFLSGLPAAYRMKEKILKDIFASSIQVILNQAASLVIFLITSTYLFKYLFGELNWCIAIITLIISLLSFGMEPIIVKRIAAGEDIRETTGLYFLHTLFTGLLFVVAMVSLFILTPLFFRTNSSFILLSLSFLLSYFSSPFKQLANGRQWFHYLAAMSIISNLIRAAGLLLLIFTNSFSLQSLLLVFVAGSLCELILSIWLMLKKTGLALLNISWNREKYFSLVKESLPQLCVAFFSISLARFDWIILGIMTTKIITAEYSFAYKVYELCTLPLLIIGPLLLPRFTRTFSSEQQSNLNDKKESLFRFVRMEIIIASFIGLLLNLVWIPVIDGITGNKYGATNSNTIFILSCSMPFLYVTNFLWTINFAQGYLKKILGIITITFLLNIIGNILLIPLWQAAGAAFAFLFAIIIQTIIYLKKTAFQNMTAIWLPLIICPVSAFLSGWLAILAFGEHWLMIPCAIISFIMLLIFFRQIIIKDWVLFKKIFST